MIVGEAPGRTEDELAIPFVGESGKILRDALDKTGCNDPFITNAAKCRPPANRTPTTDEVDACFTYLEKEVEDVDPVAIMTLGNVGMYSITGLPSGITRRAGVWLKVTHPRGDPLLVLPNYHPAYVLRNPHKKMFFEEVVDEFVRVWQYGLTHTLEETWKYAMPE